MRAVHNRLSRMQRVHPLSRSSSLCKHFSALGKSNNAASSTLRTTPPATAIDFSDTRIGFASKSNVDLVRGLVVLFSCQEFVVRRADQLISLSRTLFGRTITNALVRSTFFKHFCAGETEAEAIQTMEKLKRFGVGGILDFAAEGDITTSKKEPVPSLSREYEYESEKVCDERMLNFEKCVTVAGKGGFAAVKVTALGDAETVRKIAQCVTEIHSLFARMEFDSGGPSKLTKERFADIYDKHFIGGKESASRLFDNILKSAQARFHNDEDSLNDEIDVWEWLSFVTPREFVELSKHMRAPPSHFVWSLEDSAKMDRMTHRLDRIAEKASALGVRIMIDAEQTYFQPAIDALTLELQRRHNAGPDGPVVFSTYQAYLKDSRERLKFALKAARREKWAFACKVVRGAYMVRERALAEEEKRPSPIHDTIDDTAKSYKECCELVLRGDARNQLVVASHNKDSVAEVLDVMSSLNRTKGTVSFAQLYGMADAVSFALANAGHPVYKYLPFGEVELVVPYLVRRAQENSSVTASARSEMMLIQSELKRRLLGRV